MSDDNFKYAVKIAAAWLNANPTALSNLPKILEQALKAVEQVNKNRSKLVPAVKIADSLHDDYLICLEDGKKMSMLKRYLQTKYNLTPEEYRARWGLPVSYPMVAPNYAKTRAKLARKSGLGKK
jgi:predicted transcriptional regulator